MVGEKKVTSTVSAVLFTEDVLVLGNAEGKCGMVTDSLNNNKGTQVPNINLTFSHK